MRYVGVKQAREALPALVRRAEAGDEIAISRRGTPVARLVGVSRQRLPSLREFRRSLGAAGTSSVTLLRAERTGDA